jgi:hypothetical protein
MSKTNGSRRRCPDREPRHTLWWALIKVVTRGKLYRRLIWILLLGSGLVGVLAALATVVLLARGTDVVAIVHDLAAVMIGLMINTK